jgi:hypothetical protein
MITLGKNINKNISPGVSSDSYGREIGNEMNAPMPRIQGRSDEAWVDYFSHSFIASCIQKSYSFATYDCSYTPG